MLLSQMKKLSVIHHRGDSRQSSLLHLVLLTHLRNLAVNHITLALLKSIYLAQLSLRAATGVRIEVDQSVIDGIKEVQAVVATLYKIPTEDELDANGRDRLFKDATQFNIELLNAYACKLNKTHMRLVIRDRSGVDEYISSMRNDFEKEPHKIGKTPAVWALGWAQFIQALEEHPYFFMQSENL